MPRETVIIKCEGNLWRRQAAAEVLSWLAYPSVNKQTLRKKISACARAEYHREKAKDPKYFLEEWGWIVFIEPKEIAKILENTEKEIRTKRLISGRILEDLINAGSAKEISKQPGVKINIQDKNENKLKLNTTKIAQMYADEINDLDKESILKSGRGEVSAQSVLRRIWPSSKSVAHIGLALGHYLKISGRDNLKPAETIWEGKWLKSVIPEAEFYRELAIAAENVEISEAETVRIIFAENGSK